jgi:hypothetical protein
VAKRSTGAACAALGALQVLLTVPWTGRFRCVRRLEASMSNVRLVALATLVVAGCAKQTSNSQADYERRVTERELADEGLILQEVDLDGDGAADVVNYLRPRSDAPRLLIRKEMDLNRDGRIDVVSFFSDVGVLEKEEMDSDYDGKFDWTDHYKDGVRVMSEWDSDFDGVPNVYKYYTRVDGKLVLDRKERDTDGDGRIDLWERFGADGQVIRTGRDTDGDGKMDVREE